MMKNILILITALNVAYFIVSGFINQNNDVDSFLLLPFGLPAVISFILFFAGIVTLINKHKRFLSWLIIIVNGALMLLPLFLFIFI